MNFHNKYQKLSANLLNKYADKHLARFKWVRLDLKKANMTIMLREYLSMCFLTTILAPIVSFPLTFVVLYLIGTSILFSLLISGGVAAAATAGTFALSVEYPAIKAQDRKRNIDNNLPFAVLYMNTVASTGAPPYSIFKVIADFKEYGEVSIEAQKIVERVEVMGQDIEVAMERTAELTPSEEFEDLLWGMVTTIVAGGDIRTLLREKAVLLMDVYRRKMDEYANNVSMYIEIYITLVIVGSIFSTVMLTIMGAISGFEGLKMMQQAIVFILLPVSGIVFLLMVRLISPIT